MSDSAENQQLRKKIEVLEAALKEARDEKDYLNFVLTGAEIGIWEYHQEGDCLLYSQDEGFWNYYLGYQPSEAENTFDWWFQNLHPESQQEYKKALKRYYLKEADYLELEYRLKTKSGGWVWFWARGVISAYDSNNAPAKLIGVYRNITELKAAELKLHDAHAKLEQRVVERTEQLSRSNRFLQEEIGRRKEIEDELIFARQQAELANEAKSEFLANVSHELRTPMHHIINYSKFGLERPGLTNEKRAHYFSQIRTSSKWLMTLLNDLLDLSKMESGKAEYSFQDVDMFSLVSGVASELNSQVREKDLILEIATPSVPTILICDSDKMKQVFRNLLSNAIEFTPAGRQITVTFDCDQMTDGRKTCPALKMAIIDQGIGIPDDEKDTIFERFVQSSRTRTGAGGTGLGLSICRQIITDHHGHIWADHNPEGGTIFFLKIPLTG